MTTLAELRTRVLNQLSDAGNSTWSDAVIEEWTRDAIRDYTQYLPRVVQGSQFVSSGTFTEFSLPEDFRAMVRVQHQYNTLADERYLTRLARDDQRFVNGAGYYYDILARHDMSESSICYLSFAVNSPGSNELIQYEYEGDHVYWSSGSSWDLTVPWRDEPVLVQYVIWKAWLERATFESQNPDSTTLLLATFATNADKAERAYRRMIDAAQKSHQAAGTAPAQWVMDKWQGRY